MRGSLADGERTVWAARISSMTRRLLLTLLLLPAAFAANEEREVIATVERLFAGMAARDETAIRAVLTPEGKIYSMRANLPAAVTSHADFASRIAAAKETLLERMWEPKVLLQDRLATLWAPYDFHRGGKLTHCGVDSVTLIKTYEGWKIAGVFFTVVEAAKCAPSPLGPPA